MSVVGEILTTWRNPAAPVGRLLSSGPREDRSLVILIAATILMFVARMPDLARQAALKPEVPLEAHLGISLFVMLFVVPLMAYLLAGASHLILRAVGRQGQAYGARVALFWALLAVSPGLLFHGLLLGLNGPDVTATRLVGLIVFVAFLWFWGRGLAVAYSAGRTS